jgi:hypothetical protein
MSAPSDSLPEAGGGAHAGKCTDERPSYVRALEFSFAGYLLPVGPTEDDVRPGP